MARSRTLRACDVRSSRARCGPCRTCSTSTIASDLGSTFHCRGVSMLSVGSLFDVAIEQQVLVEVAQRRELAVATLRASTPLVNSPFRKSRTSCRRASRTLPARWRRNSAYLLEVRAVRSDAKRRKPLLDLQVVEEGTQEALVGVGGLHLSSMAWAASGGNDEAGTHHQPATSSELGARWPVPCVGRDLDHNEPLTADKLRSISLPVSDAPG